ncbi:MAG: hypothetical protein AAB550_00640 [Patescibacteria group bacterium]
MDQKAINLLKSERVCALSVCLPDGGCHNAAMHFSLNENPLTIYIQTENTSIKCQKLPTRASIVIGFSEETMQTLQLDGEIKKIEGDLTEIHKIHYVKNPTAEQYKNDPGTVFLTFTPTWWRYSDYKNEIFLENT